MVNTGNTLHLLGSGLCRGTRVAMQASGDVRKDMGGVNVLLAAGGAIERYWTPSSVCSDAFLTRNITEPFFGIREFSFSVFSAF